MTITNPDYYKNHQSGIECIEITRHLPFNRGNAIKYLWRLGKKDVSENELKKAIWYLEDELKLGGHLSYENHVDKLLSHKLEKLALYQDINTNRLFCFIVFGNKNRLIDTIEMIKEMCDDNI